jgi:flagella basal body P-ring formation protein FlgA
MNSYINYLMNRMMAIALVFPIVSSVVATNTIATLYFNDSTTVNDTAIYLRDIASVTSDTPALSNRLLAGLAGVSAPPGHSRFISTADVITFRLKPIFKDVEFRSNNTVRVLVKTGYVEKKILDYNNLIMGEIKKRIAWNDGDWTLAIDNSDESFKCFNCPLSIEIKGLQNSYPRGALQLQFIATQYGRSIRIPLSCRMTITTSVMVAKNDIPRDHIISVFDCESIKKDISRLGPEPFFAMKDVIGKKACRTINSGSILTHQGVKNAPDVFKGDNLSITVSMGNVRISVEAVARENGFKGQKIWVQNTTTNKLVRVMITDKNSASLL